MMLLYLSTTNLLQKRLETLPKPVSSVQLLLFAGSQQQLLSWFQQRLFRPQQLLFPLWLLWLARPQQGHPSTEISFLQGVIGYSGAHHTRSDAEEDVPLVAT